MMNLFNKIKQSLEINRLKKKLKKCDEHIDNIRRALNMINSPLYRYQHTDNEADRQIEEWKNLRKRIQNKKKEIVETIYNTTGEMV